MSYEGNSLSDFAMDELYQLKESVLPCRQEFGKSEMKLNVIDFANAPYIKLHKLLFKYAQHHPSSLSLLLFTLSLQLE